MSPTSVATTPAEKGTDTMTDITTTTPQDDNLEIFNAGLALMSIRHADNRKEWHKSLRDAEQYDPFMFQAWQRDPSQPYQLLQCKERVPEPPWFNSNSNTESEGRSASTISLPGHDDDLDMEADMERQAWNEQRSPGSDPDAWSERSSASTILLEDYLAKENEGNARNHSKQQNGDIDPDETEDEAEILASTSTARKATNSNTRQEDHDMVDPDVRTGNEVAKNGIGSASPSAPPFKRGLKSRRSAARSRKVSKPPKSKQQP
ncbi:hypothetical protein V8F20_003120 [Naviculisporaceae sp. PSN 640]